MVSDSEVGDFGLDILGGGSFDSSDLDFSSDSDSDSDVSDSSLEKLWKKRKI